MTSLCQARPHRLVHPVDMGNTRECDMKVHDLATQDAAMCRTSDDLCLAGWTMLMTHCRELPVVSSDGKLAGILTDSDIQRAVTILGRAPTEISAGEACGIRPQHCCRADQEVAAVLATLRDRHLSRMVVVADDGKYAGILSYDELARTWGGGRSGAKAELRDRTTAIGPPTYIEQASPDGAGHRQL